MSPRPVLDRCPGVLRPFEAADGLLVRLRAPGGRFGAGQLVALAELAEEHGAPFLQLTSRGNLQVRGLPDPLPVPFVGGVRELGLLPSADHERVRNVVAAPSRELDALVHALDEAVQGSQRLTGLPGRWLFVVTDTGGIGLDAPYDVAFRRLSSTSGELHCGTRVVPCPPSHAPAALAGVAELFLDARPGASVWNVRDLPDDSPFFHALPQLVESSPAVPVTRTAAAETPATHDVVVGVPLGLLTPDQARVLARLGDDLVVTPERSVVVRAASPTTTAAAETLLRSVGLEPGAHQATAITACIGAPYCRRTISRTVDLTRTALALLPDDAPRTHVVGCERACGAPTSPHVLVTAPSSTADILTATGLHD